MTNRLKTNFIFNQILLLNPLINSLTCPRNEFRQLTLVVYNNDKLLKTFFFFNQFTKASD